MPPTPSAGCIAGRKRSREDIFDAEEEPLDGSMTGITGASELPRSEPTYGPGMTLVHPNDASGHYSTAADQSAQAAISSSPTRPIMASRKSQRLDASASSPVDITASISEPVPRAPGTEPLIDEATRLLGVSWTRLDSSEGLQIAKRAYTRWIARHYSMLVNVDLWFENSAIPGYLGKATNTNNGLEEFYLWSYDLHQAILVTRQPNDLILKLSQPHMSLSQATETIRADLEPVVEASAANAAILHNDRFIIDQDASTGGMEID